MDFLGFPGGSEVKKKKKQLLPMQIPGSIPGLEDPWRKKWQPMPVFLPGKSHGQRSLVDYSPWVARESDTA